MAFEVLPVVKRTMKGGRSTDAAVLEELAAFHPVIGPARFEGSHLGEAPSLPEVAHLFRPHLERMREEMGPEFDEVDWRRLDPRQYDPRRIVMDALRDQQVVMLGAGSAGIGTSSGTWV